MVQLQRSARRMFHQDRTLGQDVAIPRRRREAIRRSRGDPADAHRLNTEHWQRLIAFLEATGLRRREAAGLRVGDVRERGVDFERIPTALDVHRSRRAYAQALYRRAAEQELPKAEARLPAHGYDREAAAFVSVNLGHRRLDVVLRHYLRSRPSLARGLPGRPKRVQGHWRGGSRCGSCSSSCVRAGQDAGEATRKPGVLHWPAAKGERMRAALLRLTCALAAAVGVAAAIVVEHWPLPPARPAGR